MVRRNRTKVTFWFLTCLKGATDFCSRGLHDLVFVKENQLYMLYVVDLMAVQYGRSSRVNHEYGLGL